jgi:hypothetical protein
LFWIAESVGELFDQQGWAGFEVAPDKRMARCSRRQSITQQVAGSDQRKATSPGKT